MTCLLLLAFCAAPPTIGPGPYAPTAAYVRRDVSGFQVLIHPDLARSDELRPALDELKRQLDALPKLLPPGPLKRLREVRLWLEHRQRWARSAAQFHPSAGWLRANGYNPDKAGGVEISHSRHFVTWSERTQPFMVLHELAHAYHHHVLGFRHAGIRTAYKQAMERKLYDRVKHVDGRTRKGYAATNEMEYFAELSEAYFGKNDFFPFTREELRQHDPEGFKAVREAWEKGR